MRCAKIAGLAAMCAIGLMMFAGNASAGTRLTSPTNTLYTNVIHAVSEGKIKIEGVANAECDSTLQWSNESHGTTVTATGNLTFFTFFACNAHVVTLKTGEMIIHSDNNSNGTLTSSGLEFTVEYTTIFGNIHCVFLTNNTDIGTLTGSHTTGGNAIFHLNGAIPAAAGSQFLCGAGATLTGTYRVTTPNALYVD